MNRPIGYYVHHHGMGHRSRALAIAGAANGTITLLGTGLESGSAGRSETIPCIDLPDDRRQTGFDGRDGAGTRPPALHYAPIDHDGVRRRIARIADWIAQARPALLVVDVSCEVAMLARIASVPTVYVRLAGLRDDDPHRQAFIGARALLSPFAAALDDPAMPDWVRAKTVYVPGLAPRAQSGSVDADTVLVVLGQGGAAGDVACWARAAAMTPTRRWRVIGPCAGHAALPANLSVDGWIDDPADRIAAAGIVVGSGGDGVVGAVIAARRPFVCMPEDRPFDEQRAKATRLAALGAAVLCEAPASADWPRLLDAADRLDPAVARSLDDADGAAKAAAFLWRTATA